MTGISLQMQWPLISQSHGSFLEEYNWFFIMYILIKLHALIRLGVSPPSFDDVCFVYNAVMKDAENKSSKTMSDFIRAFG
jgi:hypothetical protein